MISGLRRLVRGPVCRFCNVDMNPLNVVGQLMIPLMTHLLSPFRLPPACTRSTWKGRGGFASNGAPPKNFRA